MRDLHNHVHVKRAISPVSVADNTALVSQIIDRRGFQSLEFILATGALADADATFTVLVEDGDAVAFTDAAPVIDAQLLGTEALASFQFDDDDEVRKIGYAGNKRYVRLTVTPAGNAAGALISAVAVLGHPDVTPTANPPV